jgi:hypothetical protein
MKLDPGMHIGMHLVSFGKLGVTIRHPLLSIYHRSSSPAQIRDLAPTDPRTSVAIDEAEPVAPPPTPVVAQAAAASLLPPEGEDEPLPRVPPRSPRAVVLELPPPSPRERTTTCSRLGDGGADRSCGAGSTASPASLEKRHSGGTLRWAAMVPEGLGGVVSRTDLLASGRPAVLVGSLATGTEGGETRQRRGRGSTAEATCVDGDARRGGRRRTGARAGVVPLVVEGPAVSCRDTVVPAMARSGNRD